jgi:hypothetical protein
LRFRVHTDARYIDGEVAAGQTLTVYEDEAGSTAATLYTSATGAEEAANPYTVPGTGVCDFWTTTSAPWVLAEDDTVVRPLGVLDKSSTTPSPTTARRVTAPRTTPWPCRRR